MTAPIGLGLGLGVGVAAGGWDNPVDRAVMQDVVDHRSSRATWIADAVMSGGTTLRGLVLVACVGAFVVLATRAWRSAVAGALALVVAGTASALLKSVFERARPPADLALVLPGGWSFPSTQASETAALAVAVILTAPWAGRAASKPVASALVGATVLVGACMVYLGAHWPTDVLAGWVLGAVAGVLSGRVVVAASRRRRRPEAELTTSGRA